MSKKTEWVDKKECGCETRVTYEDYGPHPVYTNFGSSSYTKKSCPLHMPRSYN